MSKSKIIIVFLLAIIVTNLGFSNLLPNKVFAAASPVRITEIMYDPSGDGTKEFVEIYNGSDKAINLAGWSMYGVDYVFPSTNLNAGEYISIVRNLTSFRQLHPSARVAGQYTGKLKGGGELIKVFNNSASLMSQVSYSYTSPWPSAPKDGGPSLSLVRPTANEETPGCWSSSAVNGGSPSKANSTSTSGSGCSDKAYPVSSSPPATTNNATPQPSNNSSPSTTNTTNRSSNGSNNTPASNNQTSTDSNTTNISNGEQANLTGDNMANSNGVNSAQDSQATSADTEKNKNFIYLVIFFLCIIGFAGYYLNKLRLRKHLEIVLNKKRVKKSGKVNGKK